MSSADLRIPWNSNYCKFCDRYVNKTSMSYHKPKVFKCARCCRLDREARNNVV